MIEAVSPKNLEDILPLIADYQAFYQVSDLESDVEKNRRFFGQFGEDNPVGCQFIYRSQECGSNRAIGFATLYFTYASTIAAKVAVLNDLYVQEECRGQGIARALIEHCRAYAARHSAVRLQWVTAPDNHKAQVLYDSLDVSKSTWHFYSCPTMLVVDDRSG
jgi:GNAT superfamily N-acetyltransferase